MALQVTPLSRGTASEVRREPEAENPGRIIDVNVMGTVAVLDWARAQRGLKRFIYVSSGAVYKHHGPDHPGEPLPEDGYVMPRRLYGISKLTSELVTERYGDLFGFSTASVRPSSVYGPMDRVTASRDFRHVPNRVAHMALDGVKRVRVNTLAAVGDYIHADDVAAAIVSLLKAPQLHYSAYNVAAGVTASIGELVRWAAEKVPGFGAEIVPPEQADILQDPLKDGMWGCVMLREFSRRPAGSPARCVRHCTPIWTGSQPGRRSPQLPAPCMRRRQETITMIRPLPRLRMPASAMRVRRTGTEKHQPPLQEAGRRH